MNRECRHILPTDGPPAGLLHIVTRRFRRLTDVSRSVIFMWHIILYITSRFIFRSVKKKHK